MFCTNCGKKNVDGAKFCEACGKPMANNAIVTPPVAEPVVTQQPVNNVNITQAVKSPKKPKKTSIIICVIAGVLVLVAGITAVLFATGAFGDEPKEEQKTEDVGGKIEDEEIEDSTESTTEDTANTTESTTTTTTTTEKPTESQTQAIPKLTKARAKELIDCFANAELFGLDVECEYVENLADIEIPDAQYSPYATYYVITNFKSIDEGRALTKRCLSDEIADLLWDYYKNDYFEYNGKVYLKVFGMGAAWYDTDSIVIQQIDEKNAIVSVDVYDETATLYGTATFEATFVNGVWKMTTPPTL